MTLKPDLLATKFHRPAIPVRWVSRPRLIQRLNEGLVLNRPVTLVSAPAGFGKTTCISEWVEGLVGRPVSWLSLDPSDDDPGRFFTYFIAALQQVDPGLGREIEAVLRSGQLPPGEIISATLINEILPVERRFLLVLDDFQAIQDRLIRQFFESLITNLPQPLHLVLITREDPLLPLARLRANNQLTEIRARDLRFSSRDTRLFLNEVMELSLSPADIAVLEDKTEGWIAGLQLAGLSVRDRPDPSGLIAALSGSHRYVLNYLTEQVLDRQPEEIRNFLLQTSVLDKLNGGLCDAVTGRSDGRALLEQLFSANLFLIPLDDEGQWYRYHHLFADLLRGLQHISSQAQTTGLHRRAGRWYAQAGMMEEAIGHALSGEDYAMAVELLETHAMELVMQGYAKTVHGWVQAVPEEWISRNPRTDLAFAWMHLLRGDYDEASLYLERLQGVLERDREGPALQGEWLALQSLALYMQGKAAESKATASRALEIIPEQEGRARSLAYYALGSANWLMSDYPQAVEAYQAAMQHGRAAENMMAEIMSTVGLGVMAFEHGQLRLAHEIVSPASERIERSGMLPPICGLLFGLLGEINYQWHQIDTARQNALRALQLSKLGGYNTGIISCRVLLSRLAQLEGDLETAAVEIQEAASLLPVNAPGYIRQEFTAQQVDLYLARGLPDAAVVALEGQGFSFQVTFSAPDLPPGPSIPYSLGLLYNSSLRTLLAKARDCGDPDRLRPGIELAEELIAKALESQTLLVALEALLLRAQMMAALGPGGLYPAASRADYARALELGVQENFIGVFVAQGPPAAEGLKQLAGEEQFAGPQTDYLERILSAFSKSQPPGEPPLERSASGPPGEAGPAALLEPLSARELDVLRLMAAGLKYKEIAAALFISMNTVRSHTRSIYGKLEVNNRTKAVEKARQLQVL